MKLLLTLSMALGTWAAAAAGANPVRADETPYQIDKGPTKAAVGVPGKAALTVQGKSGWHINDQAPITVTAKADPGVELPKPKLVRADLTQSTRDTARFEIPFTAAAAGKKTITAEARFVVCQEQACKPIKETVALEVDVSSAAAPPAGAAAKSRARRAKPPTP